MGIKHPPSSFRSRSFWNVWECMGMHGNVWECMGMDGIIQTGWNIIREHLRAKIISLVQGSVSPSKWVFQRQGMQNAEITHA